MKRLTVFLLLTATPVFLSAQTKEVTPLVATPYFSDPSLSPDATEIAFVSGGDIWTVPAAGGEARLLVAHPDYDSRPLYSPDGHYLAFNSTRSGNGDIYLLNLATGLITRLTYDDGPDEISAWSRDGKYVYFSSPSRDIAGMRDIFRVPVSGGTPMPVSDNRYINEFFAMPSPDGKTLAFSARGVASHQWWRNGHSHLDESEIWLLHDGKNGRYEKITERGSKHLWPMWSSDGQSLYYVSDKTGVQNLYVRPIGGTEQQLTQFKNGRLLWPVIAYNGKAIVFEKDFKVWHYDIASGKTAAVNITRKGAPASPGTTHISMSSAFREPILSPDGKKIAFIARGDVFVASAKEGGDATRVTYTQGIESGISWDSSSNIIAYASSREGIDHIYQYSFTTEQESKLTHGPLDDAAPKFSPDGKFLSFIRNGAEINVIDRTSQKEQVIAKGFIGRPPFSSPGSYTWSPDSKWIAYAGFGAKAFRNVYAVPIQGGSSKPISFLANAFGDGISWSKNGKYILFNTSQRTENASIARIDLVPQNPHFEEDQFRNLFTDQVPASTTTPKSSDKKNTATAAKMFKKDTAAQKIAVEIKWEGIQQRINLLPAGVDVGSHAISPDGKILVLTASVAGQENIFSYSLDEQAKERPVLKQITATAAPKGDIQFTPDGNEVLFTEQGKIQSVNLETRQVKPLAITAETDIDFGLEKTEVFRQAWDIQDKGFYDPGFHGTDWNKVKETYAPLAAGAGTPDELRRLLSLMVGELNASHSGVSGPAPQFNTGRIGLRYDREEYERSGRLMITEVIASGPAAIAGNIKAGDYLQAIDGTKISGATNADQLLMNKTGKMVTLSISATPDGKEWKKIKVQPVNYNTEKGLLYKQWVQQQRDYVSKVSNNRLGYVHMYDMSQESLNQLYLDLDAENHSREGVVVDIRNNNGGFVNAYALDILSRKGYMTMTVRGLPAAPARIQLGQRSLEAPTILITNQHSLSDAEDFSEGYRSMKLGKIVGEPTGGWIIYTSNFTLLDGTQIRLPFIKVTDSEGKNMELNPRPVDIALSNPLGETDKDRQLDTAVSTLLKQIDQTGG